MSRRYLTTLALAAVLVLGAGLLVRHRLLRDDAPAPAAPPSEAATLQQLTQEGQLRRMSGFLAERVAAVAPRVEYLPVPGASGVRWGPDTVVSTLPGRPVIALPAPRGDTLRVASTIAPDSARPGWVLVVGRRPDGELLSVAGLVGGRVPARCAGRETEEYVLGVSLHDGFAGAGLFDLAGRTLGVAVRCADRIAALPAREVARLLADIGSARSRARDAYGLAVAPLDGDTRAYFGSDSGLLVTEVRRGGPADAAGLRPGDIVVAVDGRPAATPDDLVVLGTPAQDDGHVLTRRRGTSTATVRVRLPTTSDSAAAAAPAEGDLGISITPAAPARGVEVVAVRPGSAAAAAGLRPGDRLLRVGDTAATSPATARRLLATTGDGPLYIVFERDSVERGVLVPR